MTPPPATDPRHAVKDADGGSVPPLVRLVALQAVSGVAIAAANQAAAGPWAWTLAAGLGVVLVAATPGIWTDRFSTAISVRWLSLSVLLPTFLALVLAPERIEVLFVAATFVPALELTAALQDRRMMALVPVAALSLWLATWTLMPSATALSALGAVLVLVAVIVQIHAASGIVLSTWRAQATQHLAGPDSAGEPDSASTPILDMACAAADAGWFVLDTSTGVIQWSSSALRLVGGRLPSGSVPSFKDFVDLHPPSDRQGVRDVFVRCARDESKVRWEGCLVHPDGAEVFASWKALPWVDQEGSVRHVLGALVDHTDRVRLQEELRRTASAMDALLKHAPVVLSRMDNEGHITEFRGKGLRRMSVGDHEALGGNALDLREYDPKMVRQFERALAGELVEYRSIGKREGQPWCFRTFIFPDQDEGGVVAVSIDNTDVYTAQKSLSRSEQRFHLAVRGSAVGIWDLDLSARSLYLSDRVGEILGIEPDQLDASSLRARFPEAMKVIEAALARHLEEGRPFEPELAITRPDGEVVWVFIRGEATWNDRQQPVRMAGSVQDVTARHRAQVRLQEEVRRAEAANAAKTLFIANMSHELRTPMNAIVGTAELMGEASADPQTREFIEDITSASDDLLALIDDVLDIAKVEQGTLELAVREMDVAAVCRDVIRRARPAAADKGIALDLDLDEGPWPPVLGDPLRFKQILTNLIGNAIKFTDSGGVTLTVSRKVRPDGRLGLEARVRDTGVGIAPDQLARVFEKFVQVDPSMTRRRGGSGLGLAIVSHLVELMGGTIDARSHLGAGSTFTVHVALEQISETTSDEGGASEPLPPGLKVLVAEDNMVNQRVIQRMLSLLHAEVTLVDDGMAALDAVRRQTYDVVLMDVQMPVLDGLSASRRIRAHEKSAGTHVPIVALTAHATETDKHMCLDAGMDAYLTKPVRLDVLREALREHAAPAPVPSK